ncbi:MAG: hypothetical protein NAG76_22590 [Candidatus Pristimantibacillus lignocellulolyticus]|uniref:Uncharacterized protein n=1 Tax=Candidatus Pristimantibacillus lignocellulolyticus TaxID=2994561 RepID=A0A9J6ZFB5_9BACL|nr:MAG: hypothetical protein NAG76_22590 [Candidatus Pristimantibacillus lignocellulolyticus]
MSEVKAPLFELRIHDLDSVPEVYLNGEKIEGKQLIEYNWETKDSISSGLHKVLLKYYKKDTNEVLIKGFERPEVHKFELYTDQGPSFSHEELAEYGEDKKLNIHIEE